MTQSPKVPREDAGKTSDVQAAVVKRDRTTCWTTIPAFRRINRWGRARQVLRLL